MRRGRRSAPARCRWRGRSGEHAQGLVEFALAIPVLFFVTFVGIDVGRLVYVYNQISSASREAARLASLPPQRTSDCDALRRAKVSAQSFNLAQDPASVVNDGPASSGATTPAAGNGYIYITPAAATDASGTCSSSSQRPSGTVQVQIKYGFQPWTPFVGQFFNGIVITTEATVQTQGY